MSQTSHASRQNSPPSDIQQPTQGSTTADTGMAPVPGSVQELLAVVERYKEGLVPRMDAYSELRDTIKADAAIPPEQYDGVFGAYERIIRDYDRQREVRDISSGDGRGDGGNRGIQAAEGGESGPGAGRQTEAHTPREVGDGRRRRERDDSEYGDDERASKRPNIRYRWEDAGERDLVLLRPELVETIKILREYGVDPKGAKRSLLSQPRVPLFPDVEWNNVLAGKAVDLDRVYTQYQSPTLDSRQVEKFGDIELVHSASTPSKHVRTHGEWLIAFELTIEATCFAFEHRRREMVAYRTRIARAFSRRPISLHGKIIDFDRAYRKLVGGRRDILLDDREDYDELFDQYLGHGGVSVGDEPAEETSRSTGRRNRGSEGRRVSVICRKFNEKTCENTAADCRYKHLCSRCYDGGHAVKDCTKKPKGN